MILKSILKKIIDFITDFLPIKNIILFESYPEYSDNAKCVFDELVKRKYNERFMLIWISHSRKKIKDLRKQLAETENVKCVYINSFKYKFYYSKMVKAFIACNLLPNKPKEEQYYCNLAHGCALKNATDYSLPVGCKDADVMTISKYMAPFDAHNLSHNPDCMIPLGYARNDELFDHIDVKTVFPDYSFEKMIYWLPTYRQNFWGTNFHSDISMPILYTELEAAKLNECAIENNTLIVVKVHPAQDLSKIEEFNLSNIIFIKNEFFENKSFTNYQLLGSSDAMISDYSSVYYDYLLCDKPIGLCFDDFEEYKKREGFTMDPDVILKGGEKIYNIDDLCEFVRDVACGNDKLNSERNEIKNLVHDHTDNNATQRICDYLESKLN